MEYWNHSDVTWAPWRLKLAESRLYSLQVYNNENKKSSTLLFVLGIDEHKMDSRTKGQWWWKRDHVMTSSLRPIEGEVTHLERAKLVTVQFQSYTNQNDSLEILRSFQTGHKWHQTALGGRSENHEYACLINSLAPERCGSNISKKYNFQPHYAE